MADQDSFRLVREDLLADDWGTLTKYEFDLRRRDGTWQRQTRETYDRGNGATCLLHDEANDCVLLTRQFRLPVLMNGGGASLIETPAGLLDGAGAIERMREELVEETGYRIDALEHLYDVYMSPGAVTEYLAFFIGSYSRDDQETEGGGLAEEGEDIEVLHVPFAEALAMIGTEIVDAKTIILLQHLALGRMRPARA